MTAIIAVATTPNAIAPSRPPSFDDPVRGAAGAGPATTELESVTVLEADPAGKVESGVASGVLAAAGVASADAGSSAVGGDGVAGTVAAAVVDGARLADGEGTDVALLSGE